MIKKLFIILLLLAISQAGWAAGFSCLEPNPRCSNPFSFDCCKASTNVEKLICSDDELSRLDEYLAILYTTLLQDKRRVKTAKKTRQEQRQWIKRRDTCKTVNCLKKTYSRRIDDLLASDGNVSDEGKRCWYTQQGKGRPLCESLVSIANSKPPVNVITPNIPWADVLSIEGVREPEWKELDPLKYEEFFLKARAFIAAQGWFDEKELPFPRWFLPQKERWIAREKQKPLSDDEALKIYRDFARRGGKLKAVRFDISYPKEIPLLPEFVQYESPEKDISDWDGYTILADPDLSGIHEAGALTDLGRAFRLLIYNNNVYSFNGFYDEYLVNQLTGDRGVTHGEDSPYHYERYFCKISPKLIKRRKNK